MSAFAAREAGEFETEIALPFVIGYRVDAAGEIEVTGIVAAGDALPDGIRLHFADLPVHEQRCLRAAAEEAAAAQRAADRLERARAEED